MVLPICSESYEARICELFLRKVAFSMFVSQVEL